MRSVLLVTLSSMASLVCACGDDAASSAAGGGGSTGSLPSGSGAGGPTSSSSGTTSQGAGGSSAGEGLAAKYPGDVGIETDPAVVWVENCEAATVDALASRYDQVRTNGMALVPDVPGASSGSTSCRFTASGDGPNAVDLYKRLDPGYDELFVRWYARYQANGAWHHSGMWIGGYNPVLSYPSPQAGLKPDGDDRFHFAFEPFERGASPRMDFYGYWMNMRSWMDQPSGNTAYYGNSIIHDPGLVAEDAWQCFEVHLRLNPSPASGAGAVLELWREDALEARYDDTGPLGYWVRDKFCPDDATGTECTDYRPANPELEVLDLHVRSTTELKINAFWPQNYISEAGGSGSLGFDDVVLATERIGCIR